MKIIMKLFMMILVAMLSAFAYAEQSEELYFIDAHSQIDNNVDLEIVIKRMKENNVVTTLLASRGKRNWKEIQALNSKYPNKISPLLRSKGKDYINNTRKYDKNIRKHLSKGRFVGAAEILSFHDQKGSKAPKVEVKLDDERITLLLEESIKRGWPVIIHIEFAALSANEKEIIMDDLHDLLHKHQDHPFALIHMGQLEHSDVKKLIDEHKNIYFLTSHADPITINKSKQPWINMFSLFGGHFKEPWKIILSKHPDRFVFALDNVWADHWRNDYASKISLWREALSELPDESANLIAHGNAERLWQLK